MTTITKNKNTLIQLREKIIECGHVINNGDGLLSDIRKLSEEIKNKPLDEKLKLEQQEKATEYLRIFELESQFGVMESVTERYRGAVKNLSREIVNENNLATTIEKMIANDIAHSYVKILDNSRRLNNEFNCREITKNRTAYISILSKQLDRANRQFLNSIVTLKQLKSPAIEMTIRTNNAFVSNNQQVNVDNKNNASN